MTGKKIFLTGGARDLGVDALMAAGHRQPATAIQRTCHVYLRRETLSLIREDPEFGTGFN